MCDDKDKEIARLREELHISWIDKQEIEARYENHAREICAAFRRAAEGTYDARLEEERDKLRTEVARMREMLEQVVNEVYAFGYPESTPNAVGQPVSTEPTPVDLVAHAIRKLSTELTALRALKARVEDQDVLPHEFSYQYCMENDVPLTDKDLVMEVCIAYAATLIGDA